MTAGSWSVGSPPYDSSLFFGSKSWNGGNGKTETWNGGIRVKWNNYTMTHYRWYQTINAFHSGIGAINNQNPASLKTLTGWGANDDLRLLAKLAEQIKGHSFDLGINIAEGRKTYEQILGNLSSIGKALIALKHGHPGQALRQLGVPTHRWRASQLSLHDVSGRWLEMQYGWRPLVDQCYQAGKALAAQTGPRVLRFYASVGNRSATYNGSQSPSIYTYPVSVTYGKRIHAELYEDVGLSRSLGLVDPAAIAWEVVPYSFVVDWFIPIGTYLSVWSMIPSLLGRFITTERIGQKAGEGWSLTPLGHINSPERAGQRKSERWFKITRTVSSSLSVPLPRFNPLPKALSPGRIKNAIALIHQLL
jgi:hypothetical protein